MREIFSANLSELFMQGSARVLYSRGAHPYKRRWRPERKKPPTHTYFLAVLDSYLQISDEHFSTTLPRFFAIL